jgi:hypothetical protein
MCKRQGRRCTWTSSKKEYDDNLADVRKRLDKEGTEMLGAIPEIMEETKAERRAELVPALKEMRACICRHLGMARTDYPIGRIGQARPGSDGQVRTGGAAAAVVVSGGELHRTAVVKAVLQASASKVTLELR